MEKGRRAPVLRRGHDRLPRLAYGGAQSLYGVTPDVTCLGKIVGGGLPAAAYGASAKIMDHVSPAGPIYQAGTLAGNPPGDGRRGWRP